MILDHLDALEAALIDKGFPATSDWWRSSITDFYQSGTRQFVIRAGRRAGKSSTLCRVAVLESLYGEHHIPPGDVGIVGFVSVSRDEASARLRTIKAILDTLRVKYSERDASIELKGRPIVFRVFTGSVAGVVGGTWICALCDEVARWRDADSGANPAHEVLASLRPTMATQPNAKLFLSSSPLGKLDAHAKAFEQGATEHQRIAYAPTWIANPTITEAETHSLEPDDRIWRREYCAVPQDGSIGAFDSTTVDAAIRDIPTDTRLSAPILVIDSSSGKCDAWTWAIVQWADDGTSPIQLRTSASTTRAMPTSMV